MKVWGVMHKDYVDTWLSHIFRHKKDADAFPNLDGYYEVEEVEVHEGPIVWNSESRRLEPVEDEAQRREKRKERTRARRAKT